MRTPLVEPPRGWVNFLLRLSAPVPFPQGLSRLFAAVPTPAKVVSWGVNAYGDWKNSARGTG